MSEQNKAFVRRNFAEIWSKGNLDLVDQMWSPDCTFHDVYHPEIVQGREALKGYIGIVRAGFPDFAFRVDDQITEGDTVVTRWTLSGTHQGEFLGIPPTGKRVTGVGATISHVRDGHIVDAVSIWDFLAALRQMGVIPSAE